jgi:hypothetical protein
VTVVLSSSHGMTCEMPMLNTVHWAFAGDAQALAELPPPPPISPENGINAQSRAGTEPATVAASVSKSPRKRRRVNTEGPAMLQLTRSGTSWLETSKECQSPPMLAEVSVPRDLVAEGTLLMQIWLHLSDAADASLRCQSVSMALDLSRTLQHCRRSKLHSRVETAWEGAAATACQLSVLSQVGVPLKVLVVPWHVRTSSCQLVSHALVWPCGHVDGYSLAITFDVLFALSAE